MKMERNVKQQEKKQKQPLEYTAIETNVKSVSKLKRHDEWGGESESGEIKQRNEKRQN